MLEGFALLSSACVPLSCIGPNRGRAKPGKGVNVWCEAESDGCSVHAVERRGEGERGAGDRVVQHGQAQAQGDASWGRPPGGRCGTRRSSACAVIPVHSDLMGSFLEGSTAYIPLQCDTAKH